MSHFKFYNKVFFYVVGKALSDKLSLSYTWTGFVHGLLLFMYDIVQEIISETKK